MTAPPSHRPTEELPSEGALWALCGRSDEPHSGDELRISGSPPAAPAGCVSGSDHAGTCSPSTSTAVGRLAPRTRTGQGAAAVVGRELLVAALGCTGLGQGKLGSLSANGLIEPISCFPGQPGQPGRPGASSLALGPLTHRCACCRGSLGQTKGPSRDGDWGLPSVGVPHRALPASVLGDEPSTQPLSVSPGVCGAWDDALRELPKAGCTSCLMPFPSPPVPITQRNEPTVTCLVPK